MISANIPDSTCWSLPAARHRSSFRRGWTHGILAQIVLPVLLTGAFWLFDRSGAARLSSDDTSPFHAGWLLLLAFVGVYSHVFLDYLNNYGVRLLDAGQLALVLRRRGLHRRSVALADAWRRYLARDADVRPACARRPRDRHGLYPRDAACPRGWRVASSSEQWTERTVPAARADGRSETDHAVHTRGHRRRRRPLRVGLVFVALETRADPEQIPKNDDRPEVAAAREDPAHPGFSRVVPVSVLDAGACRRRHTRDGDRCALHGAGFLLGINHCADAPISSISKRTIAESIGPMSFGWLHAGGQLQFHDHCIKGISA